MTADLDVRGHEIEFWRNGQMTNCRGRFGVNCMDVRKAWAGLSPGPIQDELMGILNNSAEYINMRTCVAATHV